MQRTPLIPLVTQTIPPPKMPMQVTPSALQKQNLPPPEEDIPYANQPVPGGPLNTPNEKIYPTMGTVGPLLHTDKVKKTVRYVESLEDVAPATTNVNLPGLYFGPFNKVLEEANLVYLAGFVAVYFVASLAVGGVRNAGRIMDGLFLISVLGVSLYTYFTYPNVFREYTALRPFIDAANVKYNNLTLWQSALLFLAVAYVFVYILGIPMNEGKPMAISIFENLTWFFIVTQIIYLIMKYWFDVDLFVLFKLETEKSTTDAEKVQPTREEVFNIADNKYTYTEAAAVCSAYDARLASYSEIENAYKEGGEWCNYGWSEDQMIYFPTQQNTWETLQKNPATKHSCGRPGVNGGFMANPHLKFGINCFGKRPAKKDSDVQSGPLVIPKLPADIELENKVKEWQDNKDKMLRINSFNRTSWSMP